jgi:hypothetical protein
MAVNAGLIKGKFIPTDEVFHHPTLPLYVIGRWHGYSYIAGDATAGSVQAQLCPEDLPAGYPQDFYFTVYQLELSGPVGAGALHRLSTYNDDYQGGAGLPIDCLITGKETATENLPDPASIPFWLSWVIHRNYPAGLTQAGQLAMTWFTNVNLGAYIIAAAGLVLMNHVIMPGIVKNRIVRL